MPRIAVAKSIQPFVFILQVAA